MRNIDEYSIPVLLRHDPALLVIEMSLVDEPFVLDFGKVYLDRQPDYSPEVMRDFFEKQQQLWGKYWPQIYKIWNRLKAIGIFHMDPKPGNIMPENYDPEMNDD